MLNNKYKLKESVDVYTYPSNNPGTVNIQFYKINTREKSVIEISKDFLPILSSLDGVTPLSKILSSLHLSINESELEELLEYLDRHGYLKKHDFFSCISSAEKDRYSRQINYLEDLIPTRNGESLQESLFRKKIVVIGVGATGGSIASQLVRAGVKKCTLIDPKILTKSDIIRHIYANKHNLGQYKAKALANYLTRIDNSCEVNSIIEKIIPSTNLSEIISDDTDVVINTADEPYIGHITIKLGRYLWGKNIALYVAGGFDAHLMSSGELIYKGLSPCVDCCSNSFKEALADWKPEYSQSYTVRSALSVVPQAQYITGGNGGIFGQSLYSASCASMNIIDFLLDNSNELKTLNKRGEYLINKGESTWFKMRKQTGCLNCE